MRWRSAIQPVIGHLKNEHRIERDYFAYGRGDINDAILAAVGYHFNFRRVMKWSRSLLRPLYPLASLSVGRRSCFFRMFVGFSLLSQG
jgi:IS5 family transposase